MERRWREGKLVECKNEGGGQAGGKAELRVAFGSLSHHLGGVTIAHVGLHDPLKLWRVYMSAGAHCHA
jgi:hypothetical protein